MDIDIEDKRRERNVFERIMDNLIEIEFSFLLYELHN